MSQSIAPEWLFVSAVFSSMVIAFLPSFLKFPSKGDPLVTINNQTFISTKESYYYARVKPKYAIGVAIVALIHISLILFVYKNQDLALFTFLACIFPICYPLVDIKIKEVAIADGNLVVSDFVKTIEIPLSNIKEITAGNSRANIGYAIVTLVKKAEFGKKIYFRPADIRDLKKLLELHGVRLEGLFKNC